MRWCRSQSAKLQFGEWIRLGGLRYNKKTGMNLDTGKLPRDNSGTLALNEPVCYLPMCIYNKITSIMLYQKKKKVWECGSVLEHVLSVHEALGSTPAQRRKKKEHANMYKQNEREK